MIGPIVVCCILTNDIVNENIATDFCTKRTKRLTRFSTIRTILSLREDFLGTITYSCFRFRCKTIYRKPCMVHWKLMAFPRCIIKICYIQHRTVCAFHYIYNIMFRLHCMTSHKVTIGDKKFINLCWYTESWKINCRKKTKIQFCSNKTTACSVDIVSRFEKKYMVDGILLL